MWDLGASRRGSASGPCVSQSFRDQSSLEREDLACPGCLRVFGLVFVLLCGAEEGCPSVTRTGNWKSDTEGLPPVLLGSCLNKPNTHPDLCPLHLWRATDLTAAGSPHQARACKGPGMGENPSGVQRQAVEAACDFFFFCLQQSEFINFFLFKFSSIMFINAERWNIWQNYFK